MIKVLIVDDSALVRQVYKSILESDPEIKVIGTAADPYIAVQKIQKERPDVITLDIEMPRMDGLTFLKKIMNQAPMPVIVISNQTKDGADVGLKALEAGAVDVMTKLRLGNAHEYEESAIDLIDKVRSAYDTRHSRKKLTTALPVVESSASRTKKYTHFKGEFSPHKVIAIGASTGGTEALSTILRTLPENMPPILVVQHMPPKFTLNFANRLNDLCALHVKEAEDGEILQQGKVYIAPGGLHMSLKNFGGSMGIGIFNGELINRHRPSVNVLFHSVAEIIGKNAIGVILTGMGDDGASGLLAMHKKGAMTIAQDETSSVVFGMPHKAILLGGVSEVLPVGKISKALCKKVFFSKSKETG